MCVSRHYMKPQLMNFNCHLGYISIIYNFVFKS